MEYSPFALSLPDGLSRWAGEPMPCTSKAYGPRRSQPASMMKTRHEHQLDRPSAERRLNRRERDSFDSSNNITENCPFKTTDQNHPLIQRWVRFSKVQNFHLKERRRCFEVRKFHLKRWSWTAQQVSPIRLYTWGYSHAVWIAKVRACRQV